MSKNICGRRTQKNILMIIAALVAVLAAAAFFLRPGWRKSTSGTRFFDTRSLALCAGCTATAENCTALTMTRICFTDGYPTAADFIIPALTAQYAPAAPR